MTRPHNISQASIAAASAVVVMLPPFKSIESTSDAIDRIARALSDAYARGIEDAARVAEAPRIAWSSSEYSGGFNDGCNTAAKAIRALGSK